MVGIGLHGQKYAAEGNAVLRHVFIFKLIPPYAYKALLQLLDIDGRLFLAAGHSQQKYSGRKHREKPDFFHKIIYLPQNLQIYKIMLNFSRFLAIVLV